jgi:hypothetical protein
VPVPFGTTNSSPALSVTVGRVPPRASAESAARGGGDGGGLLGLISTGEGRARRLGHHIHRPMSRVSAVTSTDLTMTVSMSTPDRDRHADLGEDHQRQGAQRGERAG